MSSLQAKFSLLYLLLILSFSSIVSQAVAEEKASNFTLTDINGDTFTLSECSAKVVLLDFFATWCGPCIEAIPTFRAFYDEYSRDQLEIVSISTEDTATLEAFAKNPQIDMTWIVASDPTYSVSNSYLPAQAYIPHLFLVDAEGYIVYDHVGWSGDDDESELRSKINSIISGDYIPNTDPSGLPITTIAIIVGIVVGLFVVGIIAAGSVLGWSSSPKKRSKKRKRARVMCIQ